MKNKKKIGLSLSYDNASNSGIVNYLFSLIKALNTLDNSEKPHLVIFHSATAPIDMIKAEKYPFISFKLNDYNPYYKDVFSRTVNKLWRTLFKKNLYLKKPFTSKDADYIFPFAGSFDNIPTKVHWLVDFSTYYIPNHLSEVERKHYHDYIKWIVYSKDKVVVSSYDVLKDLKKFHSDYTCQVEVLRFAAVLPSFEFVNIDIVKEKFNIHAKYFMTPNQFWVHKNHIVILRAAKLLKEIGYCFHMIFTGSPKVETSSSYYPDLLKFVEENNLENEIRFLGIVNRAEQLMLMKHAESLIQPSLFEGWSTLVEESKALNKHIVVSDLAVHREQINDNCTFFDPHNEKELAGILEDLYHNGAKVIPYDYDVDIKRYAVRILEIFD